jgi:hypothetical protein
MSDHVWTLLEDYPVWWRDTNGIKEGRETISTCSTCGIRSLQRIQTGYVGPNGEWTDREHLYKYFTILMKDGCFKYGWEMPNGCQGAGATIGTPGAPYVYKIVTDQSAALDLHSWKYGVPTNIRVIGKAACRRIDQCRLCGCKRKMRRWDPQVHEDWQVKGFFKDGVAYSSYKTPDCLVEKKYLHNKNKAAANA